MTLKEKIELIQSSSSKEILNGGSHQGVPLLKYVFEVHQEVFGMACKSCAELIPRYILKIQNLNQEVMSQQERQYRMKSGSVIRVSGTNEYYSDLNITDEIAKKLLEVNPNRAVLFSKLPAKASEKPVQKEEETSSKSDTEAAKEIEVVTNTEGENTNTEGDQDLTLGQLREKYPHVKARSKKEFLSELNA